MSRGERSKARFKVFKSSSPIFFAMLIFLISTQIVQGSLALDFTLTDIDGNTFSLSDFRGKVVILDFFATWCGKCKTEMSHLKTVNKEFGAMIAIISINVQAGISVETLRQFREDFGMTWTVAKDTINLREMYGVIRTLELFIIDQEGYIQNHHAGVVVDASVLTEEILVIVQARAPGDVDGDDGVGYKDLFLLADAYGSFPGDSNWDLRCDFNGNGRIDYGDLFTVADNYGWRSA